jgi:uncharacterized membrane protein YebE (DUF533 family)
MDILGELLQNGLKAPNKGRIENSLGEKGISAKGGILEEVLGSLKGTQDKARTPAAPSATREAAASGGGLLDQLKNMAGSALDNPKLLKAGGIGAIAGALLGGGGKSVKGALGGGALALLGMVALQAFRNAGEKQAIGPSAKLAAGLRAPENKDEEGQLKSIADLTLKAMINAAKADGRIDEAELKTITGRLGDLDADERDFLVRELKKPIDTDAIVKGIPNKQVAAQIYAASLLATGCDTPAEKQYLANLAERTGLDRNVTKYLHTACGIAV